MSGRGGQYDREFTLKNLGKRDFNQGEEQVFRGLAAGKSDLDILGELARGGGYTFDEAAQTLDRMKAAKAKIYETEIKAEPEQFLDWDKPLRQQPQIIESAAQSRPAAELLTEYRNKWPTQRSQQKGDFTENCPTGWGYPAATQVLRSGSPASGISTRGAGARVKERATTLCLTTN